MCFHDIHHLSCLECSLEYIRKNNSVFCSEQINITNQLILLYNVKFTLDYFIYIPKVYQNFTYIIFVYRHCGISCSCRGWFLNYCRRLYIRCCVEKRGMWKKYVFLFFYNYCEVESCFFSLSHNLHDLYLTNYIQRCGGLQYEHYIGDLKTYEHVINELKFGNMGSNLNTPLT